MASAAASFVPATASIAAVPAMPPLKSVKTDLLDIAYADYGPPGPPPVVLLHGWPYDIHAFEEVAPRLAAKGYRVIVPNLRGYGATRFLSADTKRNGEPAANLQRRTGKRPNRKNDEIPGQ